MDKRGGPSEDSSRIPDGADEAELEWAIVHTLTESMSQIAETIDTFYRARHCRERFDNQTLDRILRDLSTAHARIQDDLESARRMLARLEDDPTETHDVDAEEFETARCLEAIIEASPDPIIAVDADGAIQLWNEGAESVFGYTKEEAIGKPVHSLIMHSEEQRREFEERFERALTGETFTGIEVQRTTKDGDHMELRVSTAPIRDADGTITGVVGIVKDITDLIERRCRFEALSTSFPDLCFIIDEDGVYREVLSSSASHDQLYVEPAEFLDTSVQDVLPDPEAELVFSRIQKALDTGQAQTFEYELDVPAGKHRFECRAFPLSTEIDSKRAVTLVVRDITEHTNRERPRLDR